jgi:hypothetical protein
MRGARVRALDTVDLEFHGRLALLDYGYGTGALNDGKRGTFQSSGFLITPTEMQIRLAIKLDTPETCDVDAILGGSRF